MLKWKKDKYNLKTTWKDMDQSKYHYINGPIGGYEPHGVPLHYDLHEVNGITSKDPELRKKWGGEPLTKDNKVAHLPSLLNLKRKK